GPGDNAGVHDDRVSDRAEEGLCEVEVPAGESGETKHTSHGGLEGAVRREARRQVGEDAGRLREAEDVEALPEEVELAAADDEADVAGARAHHLARDLQVRLGYERRDPVGDQARLHRVLLVDQDADEWL